MAKIKTKYVCQQCGYETARYMGKCPECGNWDSFVEETVVKGSQTTSSQTIVDTAQPPMLIKDVVIGEEIRTSTNISEFDRVLGGGLVQGSIVLLAGDPGIGKSTLILQLCEKVQGEGKALYVSGEESAEQIKLRADRLEIKNQDLMFLGETDIDVIKDAISDMKPKLVIIDSIQTMYSDEITAAAGSVSQVREITSQIMRMCKAQQITTIIIGHVTK